LEQVAATHEYPGKITVDNGTEFFSKALDAWAYQRQVKLDFIRPGRPMENGHIESFNLTEGSETSACMLSYSLTWWMLARSWKLGGGTTTNTAPTARSAISPRSSSHAR
jgi:transposase InsO family protein